MPFRRDHDPKGNELYGETGLVGSSASNASMIRPRVSLSGATSDMASRLALAPATSLNANCRRAKFCQASSPPGAIRVIRSEEHTSELTSLMRISYAVFCLKTKKKKN